MNIVCLGGGHGLARTLEAFVTLGHAPTAIVTVADNGGSTGRLRVDRDIPAIGDLRHATQALAEYSEDAAWLAHRFTLGDLAGHALGNLAILAQLEEGATLVQALRRIGEMVHIRGQVLPCTNVSVHLRAMDHGQLLMGQVAVQNRDQIGRLERLWLEPESPRGCPEALDAIAQADVITLGPGSLLTSLAPVLLVPDIAHSVGHREGIRCLHIANTTTQPGETDGLLLNEQCAILLDLIPGDQPIDVLCHRGPDLAGPGVPLGTTVSHPRVRRVLARDVAVRKHEGVGTGHDRQRLAVALKEYLETTEGALG
ncbi:gluconeogenesis factor YvcK family protein [Stomatohabitans albus]|uniref:gluconeogenesis factor YvcK family protein n=1 Tax=Stomatohabitans albus TaxID=3110766 RepID=UPI00300CE47D